MPALLAVTKTQLCQSAVCPIPLDKVLSDGAVSRAATPMPCHILVAPWGSAYWYVELLKYRDQAF